MSTEPTNIEHQFLFERPARIPELTEGVNVAMAMGAIASRLVAELRTRTIHPDGRRENVAEHSYMLAKVAIYLASVIYPELDRGKVALHSINHDDIEAYSGDTPTDTIAAHDPIAKKLREQLGEDQLYKEYGDDIPAYAQDIATYEAQIEPESRFVRIVDKITTILIQIPNEGKVLRQYYTYDAYMASVASSEAVLREQYPEWDGLISLRTELAHYVANTYIRNWVEPVTA